LWRAQTCLLGQWGVGNGQWEEEEERGRGGVGVRGLGARWPQTPARLEEGEKRGTRACGGGWALVGRGSSSYIVVVIMRDEDSKTAWNAASDARGAPVLQPEPACRCGRPLKADGAISESIRYSAYGEATVYPFVNGDYNGDPTE
jgi:hypothetical protein